jgi:hypothetical protein
MASKYPSRAASSSAERKRYACCRFSPELCHVLMLPPKALLRRKLHELYAQLSADAGSGETHREPGEESKSAVASLRNLPLLGLAVRKSTATWP